MKLFADTPARRTLQVVGDLLFVAWLVLWVWVGTAVHDGTMELAGPGRQTDSAATAMAAAAAAAALPSAISSPPRSAPPRGRAGARRTRSGA